MPVEAATTASLLAAILAFGLVLILPGFTIAWWRGGSTLRGPSAVVRALAWSALLLAAIGAVLLGVGAFSRTALGLAALVLALLGAWPFVRWMRSLPSGAWLLAAVAGLATLPWVLFALRPGFPKADTFQWYYWQLGRQLDAAGGIPSEVEEFGVSVRWLPDYLFFNVYSEAYTALLLDLDTPSLLAVWRVPVVFLALVLLAMTLRLWLSRSAAIVGTATIAVTTFFAWKFNVYKPEALGFVLMLAALWLTVRGVRARSPGTVVVAGALAGVTVGVHAIAAVVGAMLMVSAGGIEWLALDRDDKRPAAVALLLGALVAGAIVVGTGWSLQGRAVVATDALRPGLAASGDPTWTFLKRTEGNFTDRPPPPPTRALSQLARTPWPGVTAGRLEWFLVVGLIVVGVVGGLVTADRRYRLGVASVALTSLLLAAAIAFFAFGFRTYVPQHTGLDRLAQYVPLVTGLFAAFAIEGGAVAVRRAGAAPLWRRTPGRWRPPLPTVMDDRARKLGELGALTLLVVMPLAVVWPRYARERAISPSGLAAMGELKARGAAGERVLSNAITFGALEVFTGLEAPMEGRQPLIEERDFLETANRRFLDVHRSLTAQGPRSVRSLGVDWLLIADRPRSLGARATLGGTVRSVARRPGVRLVWQDARIALFRVESRRPGEASSLAASGAVTRPGRLALGGLVIVGALGLAGFAIRRFRDDRVDDARVVPGTS